MSTRVKKQAKNTIYEKHNGKCAYCGISISREAMQVDHIVPKRLGGSNALDNLNPSCSQCNRYKRSDRMEMFRARLESITEGLMNIFLVRVARKYGIIRLSRKKIRFKFESADIKPVYGSPRVHIDICASAEAACDDCRFLVLNGAVQHCLLFGLDLDVEPEIGGVRTLRCGKCKKAFRSKQ